MAWVISLALLVKRLWPFLWKLWHFVINFTQLCSVDNEVPQLPQKWSDFFDYHIVISCIYLLSCQKPLMYIIFSIDISVDITKLFLQFLWLQNFNLQSEKLWANFTVDPLFHSWSFISQAIFYFTGYVLGILLCSGMYCFPHLISSVGFETGLGLHGSSS